MEKRARGGHRLPQPGRPWQSKSHRAVFEVCAFCLALYLAYAAYLGRSTLFASALNTAAALLWFLLLASGLYLALRWFAAHVGSRPAQAGRTRLSAGVFTLAAAVSAAILGVYLAAANPGGVSLDSAVQWTQALTGVYSNWHPVFHTLLLRLCVLIVQNYTFALAVQCMVFSLAIGYLVATMHAWGVKAVYLLLAEALLVASPIVGNTMMYLWKDNAMTIGVTVLCAQAVNLYFSRGEWLRKWPNALAFGLALAFTTLVRHNAFLFTLPLLITAGLTLTGQRRGALIATAVLAATLALVWGPLYAALKVTYPNNTLEESIGLPMTVICDVRAQNPDALDAQTRAFTDAMADETGWASYQLHEYNSIKFGKTREVIAHTTLAEVLGMAARTAQADPVTAFAAVNGVTDLVWGLADEGAANVTVRNSGDLPTVPKYNGRINQLGGAIKAVLSTPYSLNVVGWYVGNIGVSFALMLMFALRALRRSGTRALLLCVPTLLYNLGTMCVLCGQDARFFSFSPLIGTLSLFALWRDVAPVPANVQEKSVL